MRTPSALDLHYNISCSTPTPVVGYTSRYQEVERLSSTRISLRDTLSLDISSAGFQGMVIISFLQGTRLPRDKRADQRRSLSSDSPACSSHVGVIVSIDYAHLDGQMLYLGH